MVETMGRGVLDPRLRGDDDLDCRDAVPKRPQARFLAKA
jgi:hypothetical protein